MKQLIEERAVLIAKSKIDPSDELIKIRTKIKASLDNPILKTGSSTDTERLVDEIVRLYNREEEVLHEVDAFPVNYRLMVEESNELQKEINELHNLCLKTQADMNVPSINLP